jgi:hypothetical protein
MKKEGKNHLDKSDNDIKKADFFKTFQEYNTPYYFKQQDS